MGALVSCCVSEAICCCASQTVSCLCFTLSNVGSVATRAFYTVGFILAAIVAWALRIWGSDIFHPDLTQYCNGSSLCWGILAVYRFSLAMVIYHAFLALVTIGVRSSQDPRAAIQNRFWPVKLVIWVGLIIGCFFIPATVLAPFGIAAVVFSAIFILLQSVLLIDLAHSIAETCLENMEESSFWKFILIFLTVLMFGFSIVVSALMFTYFSCPFNNGFVATNLVLIVISSVVSVLPRVQEANRKSGLLQPGVVAAYTSYLVASAISSEPVSTCGVGAASEGPLANAALYTGIILTFVSLAYSAFSTGSSSLIKTSSETGIVSDDDKDDEAQETKYNYTFFHLIFACAAFYMAMVLSNWQFLDLADGNAGSLQVDVGVGSTWVKLATSWVVHVLYIWTLIAPIVFPDRDFS